jgi:hypothetical protein
MKLQQQRRRRNFRLVSELRESISIPAIDEKIMNIPVQLSLKEPMATAPDLPNHFHGDHPQAPNSSTWIHARDKADTSTPSSNKDWNWVFV